VNFSATELTALGALLVSLGGVAKVFFDSRRAAKKQAEQSSERRDVRATRLGDVLYDRLQAELTRLDTRMQMYERRHDEDQSTIAALQRRNRELEEGRVRREKQLADLGDQLSRVDSKVDNLKTGVFAKLEVGDDGG
jgi:chromosome segregation ATPase